MYFDLASRKRFAKASRTTGKTAGGRVYGWLLLMAVLAGQVEAQTCATGNEDNPLPLCELSFSPSANLLFGESFNVTCAIDPNKCVTESGCYNIRLVIARLEDGQHPVTTAETDFPREFGYIISSDAPGCTLTVFIDPELTQLENNYIRFINNTKWSAIVTLVGGSKRVSTATYTTTVQVPLSGIPQESIQTTIVQPLDIVANIIAQASSQPIEGSYRAETMINWPHAKSLDGGDGTYFDRQYIINGTTGQFPGTPTPNNSTVITLNSEQVDQGFTLTTKNQLGASENGTTFFQPSWPESAIRLTQQNDGSWLVEVNSTEPVTDLTIEDSLMESIVLSDLDIDTNTDAEPINSALTFTANLVDGQSYTLRLNLQNIATTQEIKETTQATAQETQATMDENKSNLGTRSQALPQLLAAAAAVALTVNQLMSVRTP